MAQHVNAIKTHTQQRNVADFMCAIHVVRSWPRPYMVILNVGIEEAAHTFAWIVDIAISEICGPSC